MHAQSTITTKNEPSQEVLPGAVDVSMKPSKSLIELHVALLEVGCNTAAHAVKYHLRYSKEGKEWLLNEAMVIGKVAAQAISAAQALADSLAFNIESGIVIKMP